MGMSYINWTKLENEAMNSLLIERDEEIATLKKKIQHLENFIFRKNVLSEYINV